MEGDTVVAVIVSGVLTVEGVSVLNVVGALYSIRDSRYKNVLPLSQYVTLVYLRKQRNSKFENVRHVNTKSYIRYL